MPEILKSIGAYKKDREVNFCVWSPFSDLVEVEVIAPEKKYIPLQKDDYGYWSGFMEDNGKEILYKYRINKDLSRPDPASRFQPEGVHGASQVVNHGFKWTDKKFISIPVSDMIIYELHTGTFTQKNNFDGIKEKISYLTDLGINAIELMPVAQFPGDRNWGYDGVYPFAIQNSYGGPEKLKELVDACHKKNISVIMDVVYNHFGPEGNYLNDFGPYFTDKYSTPWGKALNFDDEYNDHIRNYFMQNAMMWFREYHIDALRLDAVHAIYDAGANPFLKELKELTEKISAEDKKLYQLIAESDLNDTKIIDDYKNGGFNHDAQWMDDFHHCVHTLVTGETNGYYSDFGELDQLVKCMNKGFVYDGIYAPHRKKSFGNNSERIPKSKFVVCIQNHDQVGNRAEGERLATLISLEKLKLAAACMFLSPFVPMIFMGEEYGEDNPFLYFISHSDKKLVDAVRKGRKKEFSSFGWKVNVPDPQAKGTFEKCILDFNSKKDDKKAKLFSFYQFLIELKKTHPLLNTVNKNNFSAMNDHELLILNRNNDNHHINCYLNFSNKKVNLTGTSGSVILNSADEKWGGEGRNSSSVNELSIDPEAVIIIEQND
ncbi:MAG: malto-oligosyltrehalose trehalohydrolase [Bacteroidia bacterium]